MPPIQAAVKAPSKLQAGPIPIPVYIGPVEYVSLHSRGGLYHMDLLPNMTAANATKERAASLPAKSEAAYCGYTNGR